MPTKPDTIQLINSEYRGGNGEDEMGKDEVRAKESVLAGLCGHIVASGQEGGNEKYGGEVRKIFGCKRIGIECGKDQKIMRFRKSGGRFARKT